MTDDGPEDTYVLDLDTILDAAEHHAGCLSLWADEALTPDDAAELRELASEIREAVDRASSWAFPKA